MVNTYKDHLKLSDLSHINKFEALIQIIDVMSNDITHQLYKTTLSLLKQELPKLIFNNSDAALYVVKRITNNQVLNKDIPRTNYDMLKIIIKNFDNFEEQLLNKYNILPDKNLDFQQQHQIQMEQKTRYEEKE